MFVKKTPRPAWICFLTTDPHLNSAFDEQVRLGLQRHVERIKTVPLLVRAINLPYMTFVTPFRWLMLSKYRSIDTRLMHLDRRETLFDAQLTSRIDDQDRRRAQQKELHAEIDERWMRMWRRRPID